MIDVGLATTLKRVADAYPTQHEHFANHPIAKFIRDDAPRAIEKVLSKEKRLIFKGSAGAGNFATIPWLAIFDALETTTATKGFYVVFLRATNGDLYLSLNQGTTGVRREFGALTREVLQERAALIRARLPDYLDELPLKKIELGSLHSLPRDYEAGHALGVRYAIEAWPTSEMVTRDLMTIVRAYKALIFRGGVDPSPESFSDSENPDRGAMSLTEVRQYRLQRRIERNPRGAAMAKLAHGTSCQVCGFDFEQKYGQLGFNYIEAHHLKPLFTYEESVEVELDVEMDFAVLCSNCHRMIYKLDDPSDFEALRKLLK